MNLVTEISKKPLRKKFHLKAYKSDTMTDQATIISCTMNCQVLMISSPVRNFIFIISFLRKQILMN